MKFKPYFVRYADTWLLGPTASVDTREFRIGLGLAVCEAGFCFTSEKPFNYTCECCGAVAQAPVNEFPPGWGKRYLQHGLYFLCPICNKMNAAERKAMSLFPKEKKDFWYCGEIYHYSYELMQAKKPWRTREMDLPCEKFLINPYSDSGGKIPQEGDIVPCIKLEGFIGYYLVTEKWSYSSRGSDFAMWDDGYNVNLKLHHCEKEETAGVRSKNAQQEEKPSHAPDTEQEQT